MKVQQSTNQTAFTAKATFRRIIHEPPVATDFKRQRLEKIIERYRNIKRFGFKENIRYNLDKQDARNAVLSALGRPASDEFALRLN